MPVAQRNEHDARSYGMTGNLIYSKGAAHTDKVGTCEAVKVVGALTLIALCVPVYFEAALEKIWYKAS